MKKKYLKIGTNISKKNANWNFRGNVAKNFDAHINKSIPLYSETHNLYLKLSDFFLQDKSKIVDIGCSTGIFLSKIYDRHKENDKRLQFIGIDYTKEMIQFCKTNDKSKNISFLNKEIENYNFKKCCIISSFYTIQFISPKKRQLLINKIFSGLNWGGAFFFVEKVRGNDARFQDIFNQIYTEYKLSRGCSPHEIIAKAKSLKSVLEPFSTKGNMDLLKRSGFKDIITIFKYACFEGFLAIK